MGLFKLNNIYLLKMLNAEVYCASDINDLMVFKNRDKAIAVKEILNKFLEDNSSIIEGTGKGHYKLFYGNEDGLTYLLKPYLGFENAGWLVREIGLNCYTYDRGIAMNGFEVVEVKYVDS